MKLESEKAGVILGFIGVSWVSRGTLSCTKYFVYIGFCFPSFLYDASFLLFFTRNADNGIMIKLVSRVVGGIEGIANTVTFKAENWIVFILFGNKRGNQFVGEKD